jgi:phytoene desaturase
MARWKVLSALPSMSLGKTLFQVLGEYFPTERARIAFTFQSKYLGMAPWRCPGFYAMIPFVEHRYGIYHTRGGLSEISVAMAKVATELGATFRYNTPVQRLLLDKRKVTGVVLADGREERADVVVVNADFGYAATKLVPPGTLKRRSIPSGIRIAGSGPALAGVSAPVSFGNDLVPGVPSVGSSLGRG